MAVQDNTERNLNDLMAAAQHKLAAQKQQEETAPAGDIYASIRDDSDGDVQGQTAYPNFVPQRTPYDSAQGFDGEIQHEPDPNDDAYGLGQYIDPNDTPVFEGGPGMSQLALWKKQFTKEKIFHVKVLARHFIFRTLNRFEYKQIVAVENVDALYREEMICRTCVLFPYDYDFKVMAVEDSGYPSTLAEIIMENSGFTKEYGIEVL